MGFQSLNWTQGAVALTILLIAGCSSAVVQSPDSERQAVPENPTFADGTVIDIRMVAVTGSGGTRIGIDDVLNALRQSPSRGNIDAQEVVIRKADGTATSIMASGQNFVIGQRVAITANVTGGTGRE